MIKMILRLIFGNKEKRDLNQLLPLVKRVNSFAKWAKDLSDDDFPRVTEEFKERLKKGESLDDLLPEAFALVREAGDRVLNERPYDVQVMGAIVLHKGSIAEMRTGEGKTLTSVSPAYLNALSGQGVHIVTVNDYLASRDAAWMGQIYHFLGLSVGCIVASMEPDQRRAEYSKDITYITNNELGFDYLRDNMRWSMEGKSQREHNYAIVDEIDSILIDEARTPLIISGVADEDLSKYKGANKIVSYLTECVKDPTTGSYPKFDPFSNEQAKGDYQLDEKNKRVTFTNEGMNTIEEALNTQKLIKGSLYDGNNFEMLHYVTQAMKAHHLFHNDVDYVIQEKKVEIVDEHTGRILSGRRYSDGLHQAIEAKENIKIASRSRTVATITFQNFFRMYNKISGMTGTAVTEAREFGKIYALDVVTIPTNQPITRADEDDLIFLSHDYKLKMITEKVKELHTKGQPVLVGTASVERSEELATKFTRAGIPFEILNAKNHHREASIISQAGEKGAVTLSTNMAGRGTDIKLGGNYQAWVAKSTTEEMSEEERLKVEERLKEKWQRENQEVLDLGGLYVLGTERHESRRIDNQLRGRSGRQGDPGFTQFYISLDDDLMRLFGGPAFKQRMVRFGMQEDETLHHKFITKALEKAQKRVEDRNYEIRKHLLDFDDVLNQQRDYIYKLRDNVLTSESLLDEIEEIGLEICDILFDDYDIDQKSMEKEEALARFLLRLKNNFHNSPAPSHSEDFDPEVYKSEVRSHIKADLANKNEVISHDQLNHFIRWEYIRLIDNQWQNHLENLEALREAVYLRSYAQKNPLVEYKNEGFEIFQEMVENIRISIAKKILQIRIAPAALLEQDHRNTALESAKSVHKDVNTIQAMGGNKNAAAQESAASKIRGVQVRREGPKVGRNDPCPCGSGKKYKRCHGA